MRNMKHKKSVFKFSEAFIDEFVDDEKQMLIFRMQA